jgi:hypothetical protein
LTPLKKIKKCKHILVLDSPKKTDIVHSGDSILFCEVSSVGTITTSSYTVRVLITGRFLRLGGTFEQALILAKLRDTWHLPYCTYKGRLHETKMGFRWYSRKGEEFLLV